MLDIRMQPKKFFRLLCRPKSIYFFLVIAAFFLCLTIIYFYFFYSIKVIVVNTSSKTKPVGLTLYKNRNLFFINDMAIEDEIKRSNPWIKGVIVFKQYPSTLVLTIEEFVPKAQLQIEDGYLELTDNGRVIGKNRFRKENLLLIRYYQRFSYPTVNLGMQIDSMDILSSLRLINRFYSLGLAIETIDIKDPSMLALKLKDGRLIIFSSKKDIELQIYQVERIMKEFRLKGKSFKQLDVRFEKSVITN